MLTLALEHKKKRQKSFLQNGKVRFVLITSFWLISYKSVDIALLSFADVFFYINLQDKVRKATVM